jgi:hypothetical protein
MAPEEDASPPTRRAAPDAELRWFSVGFVYVEPDYARSVASAPRSYRASFTVPAPSTEAAIATARERFTAIQRASGVGWDRVITEVTCTPAQEPEPTA